MRRGRWADNPELLDDLSRQGVIRVASLEALGIPSGTVYRRCRADGPWRRLLPGIVALQTSPLTPGQRIVATLLYAGGDAVITGAEACRRLGLRITELPALDYVHVLVPHERRLQSSGFVVVERTHRMPRARIRDGVPLAPPVRATLDVARRIRSKDPVAKLLIEAMQHGGCTPEMLSYELDHGTKRGTAVPRRVLAQIERLRSVAEFHARAVAADLVTPPTHWNRDLRDPGGKYVACPDAWWDDVGLAWEVDSLDFHFSADGYARTLARNTRYAEAGVSVVQTLPSRLIKEPAAVLRELDSAYRAAAARPRPAVQIAAAA
ncbi:hypothetical protein [Prauserella cavernicola]|uniref:AbiEi antitoxin C-terminal domain-containing protein n=1 Tax=Prauserella cavernicola TaxID=2800127 RepID=A0A934QUZ5_9PSEU|nr:hypothetical protein [Prauserella cavernicola]MBK1787056.1 hypothetical protein [Prauserella cavernicola]